jgi:hypothetical protein
MIMKAAGMFAGDEAHANKLIREALKCEDLARQLIDATLAAMGARSGMA